MKIGSVEIKSPFFLAPLAGFTDKSFREICKEYAGLMCTEMISTKALYFNDKKSFEMLDKCEGAKEQVQLFGNEPEVFYNVIKEHINKTDFEIIDINLGCPAPKIVKNKMGSYLIKEPKVVGEIVRACKAATDKPVTIKIRKSFEGTDSVFAVEEALKAGVDAVCVHGRRREDFYAGRSDSDYIKKIGELIDVPLIANGDAASFESAMELMKYTGAEFISIGRGAIGNPFIFEELYKKYFSLPYEEPTKRERIEKAIEHLNLICDIKGERVGVMEMRKQLPGYLKGMKDNKAVRNKINAFNKREEVVSELRRLLREY